VDEQERRIVLADMQTRMVTQLSRRGTGPDEYQGLFGLFPLAGDTTVMPDHLRSRWLVFQGGSVAGTVMGDVPAVAAMFRFSSRPVVGMDRRGNMLLTGRPEVHTSTYEIGPEDSLPLAIIHRATGRVDTITQLRRAPFRRVFSPAGGGSDEMFSATVPMPWAHGENAAMCSDGWIAVLRVEPYRVEWRTPSGEWIRGSPFQYERIRVNARERAAYEERRRPGLAPLPPGVRPDPVWPEEIPPVSAVAPTCASDGRLFLLRSKTSEREYPLYDIVNRAGDIVERLALDRNHELLGFGAASIYVITRDQLGIETVRRHPYPFRRPM
jgi:hypothetical protein